MITTLALLAVILAAAIVRGYSGFGFSALVLLIGGLLVAPKTLVPVLYLLELIASLWLLRSQRGAIDWALLRPLMIASAVGNPIGQSWLADASGAAIMTAISAAIGTCCLLLWRGVTLSTRPGNALSLGVGLLCGLINGMGSVGGLVVAVYLMATRQPPALIRASMVMLLLILSVYGVLGGLWHGLITARTWGLIAVSLPALALGMHLGGLLFTRSDPRRFRNALLLLLTLLSLAQPVQRLLAG